jgi:hypothetical protein
MTDDEILMVEEVAVRLRVKPSWVYGHADELGAFRLGKYLRFSWREILARMANPASTNHLGVPAQRPSPTSMNP